MSLNLIAGRAQQDATLRVHSFLTLWMARTRQTC